MGMAQRFSDFAKETLPVLLSRFDFLFFQENTCVEYFIRKKGSKKEISQALVFSLNTTSKQINVSRFYPELHKQTGCKYLSAACFYLLAHHFASIYHLPKDYPICLETQLATFRQFYSKLKDFYLRVEWVELCKTAHVCGKYPGLKIDISHIKEKVLNGKETPFLV